MNSTYMPRHKTIHLSTLMTAKVEEHIFDNQFAGRTISIHNANDDHLILWFNAEEVENLIKYAKSL